MTSWAPIRKSGVIVEIGQLVDVYGIGKSEGTTELQSLHEQYEQSRLWV